MKFGQKNSRNNILMTSLIKQPQVDCIFSFVTKRGN